MKISSIATNDIEEVEDTPLMRQWREVKSKHQDALVFFRVGDFYELFCEDAEKGSQLLGLTLTSRNNCHENLILLFAMTSTRINLVFNINNMGGFQTQHA